MSIKGTPDDVMRQMREDMFAFHCPGCDYLHSIQTAGKPSWGFNGNMVKPTITPSILVNKHDPESRCHSFVTDGNIRFLNDCWHKLKGKTVPLNAEDIADYD